MKGKIFNAQRGAKQKVKCRCCKEEFEARVADVKRGWGKYCSKSCKAIKQEQQTGQMGKYLNRQRRNQSHYIGSGDDYDIDESGGNLCSSSCNSSEY